MVIAPLKPSHSNQLKEGTVPFGTNPEVRRMKRVSRHPILFSFLVLLFTSPHGWGAGAPRLRVQGAASRGAARAPLPIQPARLGGFSLPVSPLRLEIDPAGVLPILAGPAVSPELAVEGLAVLPLIGAETSLPAEAGPAAEGPDALKSAKDLAAAVTPQDGKERGTEEVQGASDRFFSQSRQEGDAPPVAGDGSGGGAGNGANAGDDGSAGATPPGNFHSRVIFLQDVFTKPASPATVANLEKIISAGVRVVFLTWRPLKGPGSADEILLSRLKVRRTNPVVVVSYNGGKITLHGKAAAPKSIAEDVGAFSSAQVETFKTAVGKVEKTLKLAAGSVKQTAEPAGESPFSYVMELPASIPDAEVAAARGKMLRRYNELIREARLPYTAQPHPENPRAILAQSMPLRFSLPRVFKTLEAQFPEDNIPDIQDKFLILADSKRSPRFSTSFPKESEVQVATSDAAVEEILGAVLGDRRLPSVSVKLGKLRQFLEYWEPTHSRFPGGDGGSAGSGGGGSPMRGGKGSSKTHQKLAMYTGTTIYQLMAWYYEQVWRGQHKLGTLTVLQTRLRNMWYNPFKYGVYVNKPLAKAMGSTEWKAMQRGYLEYATSFVTNLYIREFADYPEASKNVQENLVGLATDRKSLITLEFTAAATGKLYKIHTRLPRVMKLESAKGRVLTAYAYRTGKETPDDGEVMLAKFYAMSLLKGYGRPGPDGTWRHGAMDGPVLGELRVQLEHRSSHRTFTFQPSELMRLEANPEKGPDRPEFIAVPGPVAREITASIERMEADSEYQEYYAEHEEEGTKADIGKKKRKAAPKAKAAAKTAKAKSPKAARGGR